MQKIFNSIETIIIQPDTIYFLKLKNISCLNISVKDKCNFKRNNYMENKSTKKQNVYASEEENTLNWNDVLAGFEKTFGTEV